MRRSKKIYLLLGILLLVCGVTFGVCKYEEKKEKIKNSDEVILEIKSDNVTSLSWKCNSKKFAFHKDETWLYDDDEAFPVSEDKIEDLLELFREFGVSFTIEDVEDYGQYGLDQPECTIQIETKDDQYEIKLGDYSTMDSERYVSIGDGNVYLVQTDPLDSFDIELKDMIDHDDLPDMDRADHITFTGSENYEISYEEDSKDTYCEEDVYFTKKDDKNCPLDTSEVEDYLDTMSDLALSDYVNYKATEDDLKTYGLDDPDLSVTVEYVTENEDEEDETGTFVLNIARDPKEAKKAEKKGEDDEDEEITAYARIGQSKIIYQLTTDQYKSLMKASYDDLRHKEVLTTDFTKINRIDISLDGEKYTITSKGKEEKRKYYYEKEELETDGLEDAIESLEAESFTDEEPDGKEEISLTVSLDNENQKEVSIRFYRYDGSNCIAVIDGEPVSLVERDAVVDLIEAVHAIVLD